MKNNKGFTLVEILGVIIILALLLLLVIPNVVDLVRDSSKDVDNVTEELIYDATRLYMSDNSAYFKEKEGNTYCISLRKLVDEDYLKAPITLQENNTDITDLKAIQVTYDRGFYYELVDSSDCIEHRPYTDTILNGSDPNLYNGTLTPVIYKDNNWVIADEYEKWYDYSKQEWANAVILSSGAKATKKIGDPVSAGLDDNEVLAMFVWIPRYEYKIDGEFGKGGESADLPGEIEVNFIAKRTVIPSNGYYIHPAFTFGKERLSGIWVGKFETSHKNLSLTASSDNTNNLGCLNEKCESSSGLRILPNQVSLRYNNISNFFYAARSMSMEGNTFGISASITNVHMMKNSEWGAMAYLSQSKYGKYGNKDYEGTDKEVALNKCTSYRTGMGATCIDTYEKTSGLATSTTGNIYGIYDMSGGSYEFVMGNYNDNVRLSEFDETWFKVEDNAKYYDKYTVNKSSLCTDAECKGHALSETAGWYGDYANFAIAYQEWFLRGGYSGSATNAGVFSSYFATGEAHQSYSTRIVLS